MKKIILTITNKSPFSIAVSRAVGNVQRCLDFIPGTALRGALAGIYLESNSPDDKFREIFTSNGIVFPNLYINGDINGAEPVPMSAYSCKYYSGFLGDRDKHGVVDMLIPILQEMQKEGDLSDNLKYCQYKDGNTICGIERKRFKGYYQKNSSDGSLKSISVNKRLIFHTAISHVTETAMENALFSQEMVEKGQTFRGEILIYKDSLLKDVEKIVNNQDTLYLGSDRTAGYGKFEITSCMEKSCSKEDLKKKIEDRINQFNEKLALNDGRTYFSITLQSDAIIMDKYMRYKTFIDSKDIGIQKAELVTGIAESRIIQGWNALTRLPKEDILAIEKGSVFVFAVDKKIDEISDSLFALELYGIGKRRGEGFGRLTVCDPFHLQEGPK